MFENDDMRKVIFRSLKREVISLISDLKNDLVINSGSKEEVQLWGCMVCRMLMIFSRITGNKKLILTRSWVHVT